MPDCKFTLFNSEEGPYAGCLTHGDSGRFMDTEECWASAAITRPEEVATERARLKLVREAADRKDAETHAIAFWHSTHPGRIWRSLSGADQDDWLATFRLSADRWDERHITMADPPLITASPAVLVLKARELAAAAPTSEAGTMLTALADLVTSYEGASSFEWGCTWDSRKRPLPMPQWEAHNFAKTPGVRLFRRRQGGWFQVQS